MGELRALTGIPYGIARGFGRAFLSAVIATPDPIRGKQSRATVVAGACLDCFCCMRHAADACHIV
jgi:hypothetical protein